MPEALGSVAAYILMSGSQNRYSKKPWKNIHILILQEFFKIRINKMAARVFSIIYGLTA
jgi:hypothetical protein